MPRLSVIDSSFLRIESECAHMHIGWLSIVELPGDETALELDELSARIAARLHLLPRFRQRVTPVPFGVGEPVWSDDPQFKLSDHLREASPALAGQGLRQVSEAFFSQPLRRDRPLWEIELVPRLRDRRAAILGKIHHAMVDGVAAVELGMLLFDLSSDAVAAQPPSWSPAPVDGPLRLALDALADTALEPFRVVGRIASLTRSPRRAARATRTLRRAAVSLTQDALRPAAPSYLNADIGPTRTLVTHEVELDRLLGIKRRCGVKLNDVVLATCAGALRRFAIDRGEPLTDLRVMVPVNVRQPHEQTAAAGNRITFGLISLPVTCERAQERLERVVTATGELKRDGRIPGSSMLLAVAGMLPEALKDRAARFAASPRLYNLIVSNVPGPRVPLYVCGARVLAIHPVIPFPDKHALSIGVLTYDRRAHFSFYADPRVLPRIEELATAFERSLVELEQSTEWAARLRRRKSRANHARREPGGRTILGRAPLPADPAR